MCCKSTIIRSNSKINTKIFYVNNLIFNNYIGPLFILSVTISFITRFFILKMYARACKAEYSKDRLFGACNLLCCIFYNSLVWFIELLKLRSYMRN